MNFQDSKLHPRSIINQYFCYSKGVKWLLILALVSLFSRDVLAKEEKDCSEIDLRTPALGEPTEQGTSYWCYAFVAADLITQATKKKVSPTDIALTNIKDRSLWDSINNYLGFGDVAKGGDIERAINRLNGQVCSYDDMPAGFKQIDVGISLVEKTAKLKAFPTSMRFSCTREDSDALSLLFPNGDLIDLFNAVSKENIDEGMRSLKSYSCASRKVDFSETPWTVGIKPETDEQPDLIQELDRQLEKNHRIVAIHYDPNFILKPEYRSTRPFVDIFARKMKHYSSIVARKFFDGKCRYLIRGSEGPFCKLFEDKRCDKADPGNVWVTFEELSKNTSSITYLKSLGPD